VPSTSQAGARPAAGAGRCRKEVQEGHDEGGAALPLNLRGGPLLAGLPQALLHA